MSLSYPRGKIRKIFIHALAWIIYGTFIFLANYITTPNISILYTTLFLLPYCATFYISVYCLNLYKKMGVLWSIASFFIVFIVLGSVGYIYIYFLLPLADIKLYSSGEFRDFIKAAILGYSQYFAYAVLYFYVVQSFKKQKQLRQLQEERHLSELENERLKHKELEAQRDRLNWECAYLRSQINPHFLHNTLNLLFSKALLYSEDLAENIASVSKIMRYSMEAVEFESDKVSVQKELDHLRLLIEINNIRFNYSKLIDYIIEGKVSDQMLPPLSMITIVENAFKYGDLKDPYHPLIIRVALQPGQIKFYCRNKKKKNNFELTSNNIGLTNLSKRLDMAFKGKYEMKTFNEDDFYTFQLLINS